MNPFRHFILLAATGFAGAQSINLSFHNGTATVAGMTTQPAGLVVKTADETWNNINSSGGTVLTFANVALLDSEGNASGAVASGTTGFTSFNANGWQAGQSQDWVMMEGWYGFRDAESLTIAGLPAAFASGYRVTVYGDSNSNARTMDYVLDDGNGSQTLTIADAALFAGAFTEGANFVRSTVLTGTTLTISGNTTNGGRSAINGLVIEPFTDSDGDGLNDFYEQSIIDADAGDAVDGLEDVMGTGAAPAVTDFDNDGINDAAEEGNGTSPILADTDGDGFHDGAETRTGIFVSYDFGTNTGDAGTDPQNPDTDGDGLRDGVETDTGVFVSATDTGTNPNLLNSDESLDDTLPDGWEVANSLDPNSDLTPNGDFDDPDEDTLTNAEEFGIGTNPQVKDTDEDGLDDDVEFLDTFTDPTLADTDGDGLDDGEEDLNGDGILDAGETNPLAADTDGDLYGDNEEKLAASDPASAASVPASSIFSSNFDANTGAAILPGNTDNTSGAATLGVTWTRRGEVSTLSDLTAISTGDSGTFGGFAQLQDGTAQYANPNVVYVSRNHNLDTDRTTSQRGYQFDFTLASPVQAGLLTVYSGHTNNAGFDRQVYSSELVVEVSGGTLGSPVAFSLVNDYAVNRTFTGFAFDMGGTTLGAGTYQVVVYQTNMTGGGAYAVYNGIKLDDASATPADLEITDAGFNGGAFEIAATGLVSGTSYVLKTTTDLAAGFTTTVGVAVEATGPTGTFTDPSPSGETRFYRIEEAP